MSQAEANLSSDLLEAYHATNRERRVLYSKIGCVLSVLLVPAGMSLEYFIYPDLFWELVPVRLGSSLIMGIILAFHFTDFGRRNIRIIGFLWVVLIPASISWMIYLSEGAMSPYYAGLNLVLLGASVLFPWTLAETLLLCILTLIMYWLACLLHTETPLEPGIFYNNLFFLTCTVAICAVSSFYSARNRLEDFRLRYELDKRNAELATSYEKLSELDRMKSDFFANVSHELRTPLTLIISPIDEILRTWDDLPDSVRHSLEVAQNNGLRLLKLINDLLDLVRLDEGGFEPERRPIDLTSFLPGLVDSIRHMAEMKGLELNATCEGDDIVVEADDSQLEKVLLNLLTNAVKFTPEGGRIDAHCRRENGQAIVTVEDTGPGIAPDDLDVIFDRFRQAESSSQKKQGVGIGLALARDIVEKHDGSLTAESQVGEGTIMRVCLPASEKKPVETEPSQEVTTGDRLDDLYRAADRSVPLSTQPTSEPVEAQQPAPEPMESEQPIPEPVETEESDRTSTVLVVEDEPDMRQFLVEMLSREHRVLQAGDGEGGLQRARRQHPDLVLLDLMLPGINGLEVCRRLRREEDLSGLKILMLTARTDEKSKITALQSGADDFLIKPFSTLEVRTRIQNHLRTARLETDLRHQNKQLQETLTELRQTRAQLVQSEKMNALGSLAAGLLHEINNPLNFTMTAVQLIRDLGTEMDEEDTLDTINDIEEGMSRIRDIVSDLRTFAHPGEEVEKSAFPLESSLDAALRLTAHELKGHDVHQEIEGDCFVRGFQNQITHVLMNLLVNAAEALERGPEREPSQIRVRAFQKDGRVVVKVRDNGVGIPEEDLDRIFDPFFTTRDVGEGMGMGLSLCHTIVENHGGSIQAQSEVGKWTEFTFDLPSADQES